MIIKMFSELSKNKKIIHSNQWRTKNINQIEKNISIERKDFNLKKHFPRLEKFIKKVIETKNIKPKTQSRSEQSLNNHS